MLLLNYLETKKKEHQLKTVPKVLRDDFQQLVDMGQFEFEHRTELTARGETYNLKELWDKRNDNDADDADDDDDADADAAAAAAAADDDDAAAADDDEDEVEEDDEESEEPGS